MSRQPDEDTQVPEAELLQTVPQTQELVLHQDGSSTFACKKCEREMPCADASAAKYEQGRRDTCKGCHNLQTLLAKNLGARNFQAMLPAEQQTDFFKQCLASTQNGVLKFKNVRALLSSRLACNMESSSSMGSEGEFQPLSYWANKGYSTQQLEMIEQHGECRDHSLLGKVYAVDIERRSEKETYRNVEERSLACEMDVKRKSALPYKPLPPPKKRKKNAAEEPEPPVVVELTDEQVLGGLQTGDFASRAPDVGG